MNAFVIAFRKDGFFQTAADSLSNILGDFLLAGAMISNFGYFTRV